MGGLQDHLEDCVESGAVSFQLEEVGVGEAQDFGVLRTEEVAGLRFEDLDGGKTHWSVGIMAAGGNRELGN